MVPVITRISLHFTRLLEPIEQNRGHYNRSILHFQAAESNENLLFNQATVALEVQPQIKVERPVPRLSRPRGGKRQRQRRGGDQEWVSDHRPQTVRDLQKYLPSFQGGKWCASDRSTLCGRRVTPLATPTTLLQPTPSASFWKHC